MGQEEERRKKEEKAFNFTVVWSSVFGVLVGIGAGSVCLGVAAFMVMVVLVAVSESLINSLEEIVPVLKRD